MRFDLVLLSWLGLWLPVGAAAQPCAPKPADDPRGIWIAPGAVQMGSDAFYPEERPVRSVAVSGFWIDPIEVTNAQFAAFVAATSYVTVAERQPVGVPAAIQGPGSAVFQPPRGPVDLRRPELWWRFVHGASWRRPLGPGSGLKGLEAHPVVHVAYEDALAFARWKGRDLPSEAEWEYAARGGAVGRAYIWGAQPTLNGRPMANSYQGIFPLKDLGEDGHRGTAPVGCYPANGFGLYDMAGNVWEWTRDPYPAGAAGSGVIKGGSFLCALSFCGRFRPAARHPGDRSLGTSHIGFRTVLRPKPGSRR